MENICKFKCSKFNKSDISDKIAQRHRILLYREIQFRRILDTNLLMRDQTNLLIFDKIA